VFFLAVIFPIARRIGFDSIRRPPTGRICFDAASLITECRANQIHHLAGHILSIAASRRTTPIFDQQQVETDLEELSREQPEEDDEFDWLDTP